MKQSDQKHLVQIETSKNLIFLVKWNVTKHHQALTEKW